MATTATRAQEEVAPSGKAARVVPTIIAEAVGADAAPDAEPCAAPAAPKRKIGPSPQLQLMDPREVHPLHKPAQPTPEEIKASPHYPVVVTANPMVAGQVRGSRRGMGGGRSGKSSVGGRNAPRGSAPWGSCRGSRCALTRPAGPPGRRQAGVAEAASPPPACGGRGAHRRGHKPAARPAPAPRARAARPPHPPPSLRTAAAPRAERRPQGPPRHQRRHH
jgi:hypothetical protein